MQSVIELFRADHADDPYAFRTGVQHYVLRAEGGGAETAELDWNAALIADLAALRSPQRDPGVVQRLGDLLRRFLGSTGWSLQEAAITKAVQRGEPVLLTLRFSAAELYALPWELLTLKASGQHLGELPGMLFRYAWPQTQTAPEEPAPRPEGGRILLGWSAAGGAVPAKEHQDAILQACARGHLSFDPARDVVPHLSSGRLAHALEQAAHEPISVLHLLCHGGQRGGSFGLCWDDDDSSAGGVIVDAGRLRQLLSPHAGRVRLVVLCACDSGNSGQLGNHLGSVAQTLHRAGIAAVVASRFPFSVAGSMRFATTLYQSLVGASASLESAFVSARQELGQLTQELDWASVQLYARAEDGEDTRPIVLRPYRGLLAFSAQHSRFFFGRDAERQEALSDLEALREAGKPRFLVVAGASGTGKSSVVLAGVVPDLVNKDRDPSSHLPGPEALQRTLTQLGDLLRGRAQRPAVQQALQTLSHEAAVAGADGPEWEVAVLRPGSDPMGALASALSARKDPLRPFLLVVDQFEEIFTHGSSPAVRRDFAARLWMLASGDTGVHCIITVRVDFLGECGEIVLDDSGLRLDRIAYDEAHRVFVAQMGPEQLRSAIEGPARLCGLQLQEGLAQRMIAEVGGEPGALPLLEYTLDLLWERRRGRLLSADSYAELGGVIGALQGKANALVDSLSPLEQDQARRILVRLVGIGDSGAADTRRRVPLATLLEREAAAQSSFESVLAAFVHARLLVLSQEGDAVTLEVAHEALIRKWERLRQWVDQDRDKLAELQEVERWVAQWQGYGTLLQAAQLGYATRVLEKYEADVSKAGREMIAASQQRESMQRSAARRRQRLLAGLTSLALIAAVVSLFLFRHSREKELRARDQTRMAYARGYVSTDPTRAVLGLRAVADPYHTAGWVQGALDVLQESTARYILAAPDMWQVQFAAFSPDGKRVVMGTGADATARVWNLEAAGSPITLKGHARELNSAVFSPDGKRLLTASQDKTARVWDLEHPEQVIELKGHQEGVTFALFSLDGKRVLTASWDKTARLWELDQQGHFVEVLQFKEEGDDICSVAWTDAGARVVTTSEDRPPRVWEMEGHRLIWQLAGHPAGISAAALSPDGNWLATSSQGTLRVCQLAVVDDPCRELGHADRMWFVAFAPDGKQLITNSTGVSGHVALIWNRESPGYPTHSLHGHVLQVNAGSFSPDSKRVITASTDRTARVWDLAAASQALEDHKGPFKEWMAFVALSPDGKRMAAVSKDTTVRVWDLAGSSLLAELRGHTEKIHAAAFSSDGKRLVTVSEDRTARVWELDHPEHCLVLQGHLKGVRAAAFSPDGKRLATGSLDHTARVWELEHPERNLVLEGHLQGVFSVAFSPDGKRLATGSLDHTARVWELARPTRYVVLDGHKATVTTVAFSPDGVRLLTASEDTTALVWSIQDPKHPLELKGHDWNLLSAAFSPDGKRVLTSDPVRSRVWDLGTLDSFELTSGGYHAAFIPDANHVMSWSLGGTVRTWKVSVPLLLPLLQDATTACIPAQERIQAFGEAPSEACEAFGACEKENGRPAPACGNKVR